jgi:hypothetical protein
LFKFYFVLIKLEEIKRTSKPKEEAKKLDQSKKPVDQGWETVSGFPSNPGASAAEETFTSKSSTIITDEALSEKQSVQRATKQAVLRCTF